MNKILFILCLTSASLWMLSCTDYEVASYPCLLYTSDAADEL